MHQRTNKRTALIDADILAYKIACRAEGEAQEHDDLEDFARAGIDEWAPPQWFDKAVFAFSEGNNTFRHQIYPDYKAHRKDKPRPQYLDEVRSMLQDWEPYVSYSDPLFEADDLLVDMQWEYEGPVIVTVDKDLLQVTGWHWNPDKDAWPHFVSNKQADYNLAIQVIMGDAADNIKGLPGIGKARAPRLWSSEGIQAEYEERGLRSALALLYKNFYHHQGYRTDADREEAYAQFNLNWNLCLLGTTNYEHRDLEFGLRTPKIS